MKKIITIVALGAIILGGIWFFNSNQGIKNTDRVILTEEKLSPESLIEDTDKLDQEEQDIDRMIDELEELSI